jgi:iron-sulfur cluster repair protein YtfE (RIC family)
MEIDVNLLNRLEGEHRDVEAIIGRMESATDELVQRSLIHELESTLVPHMRTEESQVYSVLAELDEQIAAEARHEHSATRDALLTLKAQIGRQGFDAALQTLKSGIEHHVHQEETEAFPKLRQSAERT